MKKIISALLAIVMIFTCAVPAFAAVTQEEYPIITLFGDGTQIYMPDETAENGEKNVWGDLFAEIDADYIKTAVFNVLEPLLLQGVTTGNWEPYCYAFYEEIAAIFDPLRLDGDGNPRYGTGLGKEDKANNVNSCKYNTASWQQGKYKINDYVFRYDWRLSPLEVVDELHTYIQTVLKTTRKDKVSLVGNCLGGSYILAYLSKYGTQGHIKNVFFNATVGNGTDVLTDAFCGDVVLDTQAIQRFMHQIIDPDSTMLAGLIKTTPVINDVIFSSYDLLGQLGMIEQFGLTFDVLYKNVYELLTPLLAIAVYATMPGYWSTITTERYEEAKKFVFGAPGDERYEEYKGLIAKNDEYYNTVSKNKYKIIADCQEKGVYFGASAKYGVQMYPFVKSQAELSDQLVDFEHASFGAKTAKDVFSVLPDSHIQAAVNGKTDKYISYDKQVDASTSLFKDSLWVFKNVSHDYTEFDYTLIEKFCKSTNFNVNSDPDYPQFMIMLPDTMDIDPETNGRILASGDIVPMTEENANLTLWDEMHEDSKKEPTLASRIMAFFRWLTAMIKFILHISSEHPGEMPA